MHSFQVMAEPIRRRIVEILASGEHASGEIAAAVGQEFGVTRTAVSRHLAILRNEKWVAVRHDYNSRVYRLDEDALRGIEYEIQWLRYLWERRIGTTVRNDPEPHHAQQFGGLPAGSDARRTRAKAPGEMKGWRGKGRQQDLWSPAGNGDT